MTSTATLHAATDGRTITLTITTDDGLVETHTVKDGAGIIRRIDRKLADLMWNRSGFSATMTAMTATLTRPATYTLLTTINARNAS